MTAPRRWSISLRTMSVGAALLAIPIGWVEYSLNWISERHEALRNGACAVGAARAPAGLWLLGEEGKEIVWPFLIPQIGADTEARRLRRLFPEAEVAVEKSVHAP